MTQLRGGYTGRSTSKPLSRSSDPKKQRPYPLPRSSTCSTNTATSSGLNTKGVLAGLIHRGGLRASVLTRGVIRVGDSVTEVRALAQESTQASR